MFKVAVAHTQTANMAVAAAELVAQALACLDQQIPQAGLLFSTYGLDHLKLLATLCALLPACAIVGASSYGEVSHKLGYRLGSSLLILFASDRIRIQAGVLRGLDTQDEMGQAEAIERQLEDIRRQAPPPVLGLLFPDALGLDNEGLIRVVADLLPETALFGAGAGESLHFKETAQFFNDGIFHSAVPYLFFSGPLRFSWSVTEGLLAGWSTVSARLDASGDHKHIKTIAGQKALDYLRGRYPFQGDYWSPCHPFAVYADRATDHHVLRHIIRADSRTGTLESILPLPAEGQIRLTEPDPTAIRCAARRQLWQAVANYPATPSPAGVLWFSEVSRSLALGQDPASEFQTAAAGIHPMLPIAGFYGYGQITPAAARGDPVLHHCGLATLLLGEEPGLEPDPCTLPETISTANLRHENRRLMEALNLAHSEINRLDRALSNCQSIQPVLLHSRTEQHLHYRDLVLELLCQLLDTRFHDIRRLAIIGDPPRLNRFGLARMIEHEYRIRHNQPFPLSQAQIARLLATVIRPRNNSDHKGSDPAR